MQGPFRGKERDVVIAAVTSSIVSPVGVIVIIIIIIKLFYYDSIYDQIKVTYELLLDQALKQERQKQISAMQVEQTDEVINMGRSTGY